MNHLITGVQMFDKAKQLWELQKKARTIQKELKETEIEAKAASGLITVVVSGEQHILSIDIDESLLKPDNKRDLEKSLTQAVAEALSRAQAIAAEKMKVIAGDLNIPGM